MKGAKMNVTSNKPRIYYSPFGWENLTNEEILKRLDKIDADAEAHNSYMSLAEFRQYLFPKNKTERTTCATKL